MHSEPIYLVSLMTGFYQIIATLKMWLRKGRLDSEVMAILKLDNLPNDSEIATAIGLQLNQWIAAKQLQYRDTLTAREYMIMDRACFAMVSLADELLIMSLDWPGRAHWHEVLLEQQIYQSCSAGEVFYHYVDELLANTHYDMLEQQLAAVYLLALRLGFSGRYRDDKKRLGDYRKKLFNIVNRGKKDISEHISAKAYQQCLVSEQEQRLAPLANWYRAMIYGALAYVLSGIALYYALTWHLNQWMTG